MSDDLDGGPSLWDQFWESSETPEEDYIGEPPDWYYPLVGKIAVATGGLERRFAQTAVRLLEWRPNAGGDVSFWLSSGQNLRTLIGAAKGLDPGFDALAGGVSTAWRRRNEIVHVSTGWHDWDSPDEPSGWHYEHPRSSRRVYLTAAAKGALEQALEEILALDQRVWDLYISLVEPPSRAE